MAAKPAAKRSGVPDSPRRRSSGGQAAPSRTGAKARSKAKAKPKVAPPQVRGVGAVRLINLALQGGGAHGAFTWGVLDRLLEDGRTYFDGVSGTSAGAFNAVALAAGLMEGGAEGARAKLEALWQAASDAARYSPLRSSGSSQFAFDLMTRVVSPYQFNPLDLNPLRGLLEETIDFKGLRKRSTVDLFVAATEVSSGRARIFRTHEISVDAVLASACLPQLHHAVKVGRHHYWDGGFSANPALLPVIEARDTADTLIVQLNPDSDPELPTRAGEITARMLRLTFNLPFRREIESIALCQRVAREGLAFGGRLRRRVKRHRFHLIEAEPYTRDLEEHSRLTPEWELLTHLRDCGRAAAEAWLKKHYPAVGRKSSVDLAQKYL